MVLGCIKQVLQVKSFPKGLRLFITDVKFQNAQGDWWPGLTGLSQQVSVYKTNVEQKRKEMPLEVGLEPGSGTIGELYFSSGSTWDSGTGPDISIEFLVSGTHKIGDQIQSIKQRGKINASTSSWSKLSRADSVYVRYSLEGGEEHQTNSDVPVYDQPGPVGLNFSMKPGGNMLSLDAVKM